MRHSKNRKGKSVDNAPIESFHACLKSETFILEGLNDGNR
ncbi:integrase [Brevibacillus laterosporus]|nr:integrase [Brevibacillus laterosporus]